MRYDLDELPGDTVESWAAKYRQQPPPPETPPVNPFEIPETAALRYAGAQLGRTFPPERVLELLERAVESHDRAVELWAVYILANGWEPTWIEVDGRPFDRFLGWKMPNGSTVFAWPQPLPPWRASSVNQSSSHRSSSVRTRPAR